MATAKKVAKKVTPKKEEVKQIVLTQEQWNELNEIRFTLSSFTWELENAFEKDKSLGQAAFEIGKTSLRLSDTQSKLDKIVDATDPELTSNQADFEEDKNDN
jgi:hypothetical protein